MIGIHRLGIHRSTSSRSYYADVVRDKDTRPLDPIGLLHLSVLPSCKTRLIARGGDKLDVVTIVIILGSRVFDVKLRHGRRIVG